MYQLECYEDEVGGSSGFGMFIALLFFLLVLRMKNSGFLHQFSLFLSVVAVNGQSRNRSGEWAVSRTGET